MSMDRALRFLSRRTHGVVLYTRPGCHLCEDVRASLDRLARRLPMEVQEVDITGDPELIRRYDIRIPVVIVDGRVELEAPISEAQLRAALR